MEIEYRDPETFRFEVGPNDDDDEERCTYIRRVNTHPTVKIGGVFVGRCKNKALPGMTVCYVHANRNGMAFAIRMFADKVRKLGGKI